MPDCDFTIAGPSTVKNGDMITIKVNPPMEHPCTAFFQYGETRVGGNSKTDTFEVVQMSSGSMTVRVTGTEGSITISVTKECRPTCGPTTRSITIQIESRELFWRIFWETYKTIGLPVTVFLYFLYMLFYFLSLGQLEKARKWARKVYKDGFPEWLQDLLD